MPNARKENRGLAPDEDRTKQMRKLGYLTLQASADEHPISIPGLRKWIRVERWMEDDPKKKPRAFKYLGVVWVSIAAVRARLGSVPEFLKKKGA
jgi:hypothetical protein